jgi:hypothetical protein
MPNANSASEVKPNHGLKSKTNHGHGCPKKPNKVNNMKIEIDLSEILTSEYGEAESLAESVHRQIADTLMERIQKGVLQKVDDEIAKRLDKAIGEAVTARMPDIINDVMNTSYIPVGAYGDRKKETNFRNELIKAISEQMVYKKTSYPNDRNAFTKAVDSVLEDKMQEMQKILKDEITTDFAKKALQESVKVLKKSLGLE